MGYYLNNIDPYLLFKSEVSRTYFVDKSMILSELFPLVEQGKSYVCITRPRRFGKTVMANMIGAFFSKGRDASDIFDQLNIAATGCYSEHLNRYNVIYIDFSKCEDTCQTYQDYISNIKEILRDDLHEAYPEITFRKNGTVSEDLKRINQMKEERFVFVLDEWDAVFHMPFTNEDDHRRYLLFLKDLLKDQAYVSLAFMTGILPIAKYSSGSELNMFLEYSMVTQEKYNEYYGFMEREVDELYQRYLKEHPNGKINREGLRIWYNGYHTRSGERVYNPRSVVSALTNDNLASYWTSSGPYDEIFFYMQKNIAEIRDALTLLVAGEAVPAKVREYAATSANLQTRDEIFSAMVVYGFLSYENGKVSIPNQELMNKFSEMLQKEPSLGYLYQLAKVSDRMLQATLKGDTAVMEELLEYAHILNSGDERQIK